MLTPEQYRQRDILPGWRPRAPLSDIERAAEKLAAQAVTAPPQTP